jgi:hypothetical protein
VKTKYVLGDTTTGWNFFLSSRLERTKPAHLNLSEELNKEWEKLTPSLE